MPRALALLLLLALAFGQGGLEREVFEEANAARVRAGVPALAFDPGLYRAARAHAEDMLRRGYFGHEAPGGPSLAERLWQAGVYATRVAENLYELDGPYVPADFARRAVEGWLKSPGHRRNLLDPGFDRMAVAVLARGERYVAVQEFAYRPFALAVDRRPAVGAVAEVRLLGTARRPLVLLYEERPLAEFAPGPVRFFVDLPEGARPVLVFRAPEGYLREARCPEACPRLGVRFEVLRKERPGYRLWLGLPPGRYALAFGEEPRFLAEVEGNRSLFAPRSWRYLWVGRGTTLTHRVPLF